jgi:hypothetical protein
VGEEEEEELCTRRGEGGPLAVAIGDGHPRRVGVVHGVLELKLRPQHVAAVKQMKVPSLCTITTTTIRHDTSTMGVDAKSEPSLVWWWC